MSQVGTDKLAALESTSHSISASLVVVQSGISAMSAPLEGISNAILGIDSRMDARLDGLEQMINQILLQSPPISVPAQKVPDPIPSWHLSDLLTTPVPTYFVCIIGQSPGKHQDPGPEETTRPEEPP